MNIAPRLARLVAKTGVLHDTFSVFELGCGTGQVSRELAPLVRKQVGVDIDSNAVSQYNANCHLHDISEDEMFAHCLDLTSECPWQDIFDVATAVLVLHHVDDIEAMLLALQKVLKPGGALVIVEIYNKSHGKLPTDELIRMLQSLHFNIEPKVLRTSILMSREASHMHNSKVSCSSCSDDDLVQSSLVVLVARK